MFKDKSPKKWALLATLFIIVLIAIILFLGLRARAADGRFLDIKEVTSPGGITVWLVEDHTLPVMSVKFLFADSGSASDPVEKQGLARMLSNTMDEGAGDLDSQAFQQALSDNSITLSFSAGRDTFGGDLKSLSRNKQRAFELASLALNQPRFDVEAVDRMRAANISRIQSSMSEPDWIAARLINDRAFENHTYGKNNGGTLTSLTNITPDDLRAAHKNMLARDRLFVAMAGDITAKEAGQAADIMFGKLPEKAKTADIPPADAANAGKTFVYEQNIPQTMIEIVLPAFDHTDKDYYALGVLNYIYGGAGFGSRLMEEAREKRGLTYGIYSGIQDYRSADMLNISTSTKNESAAEMVDIIKAQMDDLRKTPVGDKEIADAKSYITGSMPLSMTSTDQIASMALSLQYNDYPIDYLDRYKDNINAVTQADLKRVAERVLSPDRMTVVLVGKPKNVKDAVIVKELPNVR
ncbi:MAG: insulinase family protein [Micavibrio aeruginosavorus]|uniref:Insulinase family protein n=1 Tax=Micavibrio aeruginosavorus TaxID=349221 RepID=A0A2W4ZMY2_9BACT|nr:MAG: insulinase family protein [Micavibrio aeruginosavorus]